jgi:hypothetical protein
VLLPFFLKQNKMITNYSDIFRRDKLDEKFSEIDGNLSVAEVTLTAAQIIAMYTTPVVVVPAQGAGKVIQLVSAILSLDAGATPFTGGGAVRLQNGTTGTTLTSTAAATVVTSASDVVATLPALATSVLTPANESIKITNATAVFAAGNGTMKVIVVYRVFNK